MLSSEVGAPIAPSNLDGLNGLWSTLDELRAASDRIAEIGGEEVIAEAARISSTIDSFEPNVTLIGQIKAGKTALVNAMIGKTDLLPSDVNPWTSVVTSLHLNSRNRPEGTQALFRFFDEEEWDRLVSTGGRLGELAQRAGFDSEQEAVRKQVLAMREKSRARLGKRFELLLGTSHTYDTITPELIDRYVCHGGWDEDDADSGGKGRYADITKLANLYLDLPGFPSGLCLRDTPGVNDTFMMREQITLNSIRDSRLCIVVLSAHQALSTMDMALLRLVSALDSRELLIFVNRIDELDDPATQIPEIEANFRVTLKKHNVAVDVPILFGSALWAQAALGDTLDDIPAPSHIALQEWASANPALADANSNSYRHLAWHSSGVPALHAKIADSLVDGPGQAMLREVRDALSNLVTSIEATDIELGLGNQTLQKADIKALGKQIDAIQKDMLTELRDANRFAADSLSETLGKSQALFCRRAVEALQSHLDAYGTGKTWRYNADGLRMMLRTGYRAFCADVQKTSDDIFARTARRIEACYVEVFGITPDRISLKPPAAAHPLPPARVGQTIALDLGEAWWRKWWQGFRKQDPMAERYAKLIRKETDAILDELSGEMAPGLCKENEKILATFIKAQRAMVLSLAERSGNGEAQHQHIAGRSSVLREARDLIDTMAA